MRRGSEKAGGENPRNVVSKIRHEKDQASAFRSFSFVASNLVCFNVYLWFQEEDFLSPVTIKLAKRS